MKESIKILEQLFIGIKKDSSNSVQDKAELAGIALCIHKLNIEMEGANE